MAADRHDRLAHLVDAAKHLDVDLCARVHTFGETRDAHQPVRADHGHDHAGPAREWRGHSWWS